LRHIGRPFADYEEEPTIEIGKDSSSLWWRVLIAVIVVGALIGYVASFSYVQSPYTVTVSGSFTSPEGGRVTILGMPGCNAALYKQCPDPGETPTLDCFAPPQMDLTSLCVTYYFDAKPGQYQIDLRNGENYVISGYLQFQNGSFDKVCPVSIKLAPPASQHNITENIVC